MTIKEPFNQPPPQLANQWDDDAVLRSFVASGQKSRRRSEELGIQPKKRRRRVIDDEDVRARGDVTNTGQVVNPHDDGAEHGRTLIEGTR